MIDRGKAQVLGVGIDRIDYEAATERVLSAARLGAPLSATALAVHGVMTGVGDPEHLFRLNRLDLVTPDGQPVRWALNRLHNAQLTDRVYGPTLMLHICAAAAEEELPVYLYGSTPAVLSSLQTNLQRRFPRLLIAGAAPSQFKRLSAEEQVATAQRITESGARIVFVGLGCPRQEVFVYENRELVRLPLVAVGAAFDYHAGLLKQPPAWVQRNGLQWLYRLVQDPRRLWHRYLVLNSLYVLRLFFPRLGVLRTPAEQPPSPLRYG